MTRLVFAVVVLATSVTSSLAADVPLAGNGARLSDLKAQRKAQVVSHSPAIDLMSADPTVSGATLDLYSVTTGQQVTFSLSAGSWQKRLPEHRFQYTATGDPRIKILLVNGRLLHIKLRGAGGLPLGQPQGSVAARLTIGGTRFCLSFGGTITRDDGKRFVARSAPPPAACPAAPSDAPFCAGKADGTACDDHIACTGSSQCVGGVCVSESPTCTGRLYDDPYCDMATGECKTAGPNCTPNKPNDLCRPLDAAINTATGACFYKAPALCPSTGCNPYQCNPATGQCEEVPDDQCDAPCFTPQPPDAPCFQGTCRTEHCLPNLNDVPNCNAQEFVNCSAYNTNNCFVPVPDDPGPPEQFQGCREGTGCVFTPIDCTASQPFGPLDPCVDYYEDPTLQGCCGVRDRDCAGLFGNAPGFTYSCDPVRDVCVATPEP